ncbi:hypothetical protein HPB52_009962 [Rhipicephalus sanguineus]|uniref:Alpha 1,4-glycosyltransferase domain-containing protein n=1 Tax=Rhipicephalus sanguineus TaxID=34632 RepID=A0A9D4PZB6_RHISA|nr:hypothetical protein HPB52_009962 [Rhipicephalus sanguineus]
MDSMTARSKGGAIARMRHVVRDMVVVSLVTIVLTLGYIGSSTQESTASDSQNIWFLETFGGRKLTPRAACSIESACRHNDDYTVHLLSTGNISSLSCPYHRVLSTIPNFRSALLNASTELAGTPLSRLHAKGGNPHRSLYFAVRLSDFLRYAVIWKYGGIYLDTDVIVLRPLNGIRNSIVYEVDGGRMSNGVLFFTKNHPVLGAIMDLCSRRNTCGPQLLSALGYDEVLSRRVNFLSSQTFLRFPFSQWRDLFDPKKTEEVLKAVNGSHGVHFWNTLNLRTVVMTRSGCAMDVLARAHCPLVYRLASSEGYL